MKISMKAIAGFDATAISRIFNDAEKANKKNLQKAGALLRLIARRSLRRRKKASSAGSPPSVHSTHPYATLKNILYEIDATGLLVVGPVLFKTPKNQDRLATNAQEFGGNITRLRSVPQPGERGYQRPPRPRKRGAGGRFVAGASRNRRLSPAQASAFKRRLKDGSIVRPNATKVRETINLPMRPTMAPALSTASPKIPDIWKGTVTA